MASVKAPSTIGTRRLVLRRPERRDAAAIFERYASDPEVTRFLGWPMHRSLADTKAFLVFSDEEWYRWPAGPYLIHSRSDGLLIGGSGLGFGTPACAMTGYVLAKDAWGKGYATETLRAIVDLAGQLRIKRLYAHCHPDHRASWRVLEKNGFERKALLLAHTEFPNLSPGQRGDVLCYALDVEKLKQPDR
jgi:RimJ/RimL family protein N-acetyltransferase